MATSTALEPAPGAPTGSSHRIVVSIDSVREARSAMARRLAGVLLTVSGVVSLLGWITAEALYTGVYSTHADSLSHLGATEPPNSIVVQPSGAIFDGTMVVAGLLILGGAWFVQRGLGRRSMSIPTALLGLGVLGVGVFPLTSPTQHTVFALLAFLAGGAAVALSSRVTPPPFSYIWLTLGLVSLVAIGLGLFFIEWQPVAALGEGGIERWNAYPILMWLVAFGTWLMSAPAAGKMADPR
jgi:hypothetical membrane protein